MNELAVIVVQQIAVATVRLFALVSESSVEQLSPMTVFVTLCGAVTTLFGVMLMLLKHMIDNDKRKTTLLEEQHKTLRDWFTSADRRIDSILEKVTHK